MHTEIPEAKARRYRIRKTLADRVREAMLKLAGPRANLLSHDETPWASITFAGSRHELMLDFDGITACKEGEQFVADLPDHEFTIPRMLVADATVSEVNSSYSPEPRMVVSCTLLLLEEA